MKYGEFLSRIQTIIGRMDDGELMDDIDKDDDIDVEDLCNTIKEMIEP